MKRLRIVVISIFACFALSGCYDKLTDELAVLRERVNILESTVNSINSQLGALQELIAKLESGDHIEDISEYKRGDKTYYNIRFVSGTTLTVQSGNDGVTPIMGIQFHEANGHYYWTIQNGTTVKWLTDSKGAYIRAEAVTPQLKVEYGYWWMSYDEGKTWTKMYEATGEEGSNFFRSIDYSDPDFVTFYLPNYIYFTIPTMQAFETLQTRCSEVNNNLDTYMKIACGIDTSVYVKSTAEIVENDEIVGYIITLLDDRTLTVRTGKNNDSMNYIGIREDADGKRYWAVKYDGTDTWTWILADGSKLSAETTDTQPYVGVKDSMGVSYFTIKYGKEGKEQWMLDAAGKPVVATSRVEFRLFKDVTVSADSVEMLLTDGTSLKFPIARRVTPTLSILSYVDKVYADSEYRDTIKVNDILYSKEVCTTYEAYKQQAGIEVFAIMTESGSVLSVVPVKFTPTKTASYVAYETEFEIVFKTAPLPVFVPGRKSTIAVFLTSGLSSTDMKVITMTNS